MPKTHEQQVTLFVNVNGDLRIRIEVKSHKRFNWDQIKADRDFNTSSSIQNNVQRLLHQNFKSFFVNVKATYKQGTCVLIQGSGTPTTTPLEN